MTAPDFPPRLNADPFDVAELSRWNRRNERARDEYAAHPFSRWAYNAACACAWCIAGLARYLEYRERKNRNDARYRARRKAAA